MVESKRKEITMPVFYEVWDFETRNLINQFDTEAAALVFVRSLFDLNGPDGVRELAILRQDPDVSGDYEPTLIAEGTKLLARLSTDGATSSQSARRAAS
jgi:hypothetical protein